MCCVCISRRGMVYFGASIHIFITLILFLGSTYRAYRISSYDREENSKHVLGATVISLYFFTLLVLGCLIFRGVEHKSPKMLGWSGGTFITLETFAFVFNLVLLSPMGGAYDEYGLRNFGFTVDLFQILLSLLFMGCMAGYCVVIILYILKLREDDTGSEYTYGEFDDGGTIPAPPVATNLSRSSTAHSNYSVHHNNKAAASTDTKPQSSTAGSQGQLNQCNNQFHIGSNHTNDSSSNPTSTREKVQQKSPLLQERRLQSSLKDNHLSQEKLDEDASAPTHYFIPQRQPMEPQRLNPYNTSQGTRAADLYSNYYSHQHHFHHHPYHAQHRHGIVPYRQSQTLPHPHHYHRHLPSVRESGEELAAQRVQFPSHSRMDLATLSQTITRNSNLKRVGANTGTSSMRSGGMTRVDPRITASGLHHPKSVTIGPNFEGDGWEQPRIQALKYNCSGSRKGMTGSSTVGIEV